MIPASPSAARKHATSRTLSVRLLTVAALVLAGGLAAMPVEVTHPVADFLRRLEEKGIVDLRFLSTLPRDEAEVARTLALAAEKSHLLSAWDRRRLEGFLDEFEPERKRRGTRLRYQDSSFTLHGTVEYFTGVYHRDSVPRADLFAFGSLTPGLQMTYRDWAYLTSSGTVAMERNYHPRFVEENYLPARGLPFVMNREGVDAFSGTVSTFDAFRMIAGVGTSDLRLEMGQDWNQWGPGHWQHVTLGPRPHFWVSDSLAASPGPGYPGTATPGSYRRGYREPGEGPPLPQVRLRFGGDRWEYVKVVAQRTGLWKDSSEMLVTHRVQFRAGSWRFGFTEMLIIGSRETGWLPWLPVVPLRVLEHEGGNRDNAAMSADAEWIWRGHGRLYGEFLLDDFSGLPLNFWGNKFAWTLGGTWHDPMGLPAELRAEYARVDPWVYGHHLRGTQAQSYGSLLGSTLPPNSHAAFASATFPMPGGLTGLGTYRFGQRDFGSGGSSIFDDYDPEIHGYHKEFLANDVETRHQATLEARWKWRRHVQLMAGAGWLHVQDWKGEEGVSLSSPLLSGELRLQY
jgi:hypothetical protein